MTNWFANDLKDQSQIDPNRLLGLVNCEDPRCLHWTHSALQKIQGLSVEWQVCGSRQSVKPCPNPSHHVSVNQNHYLISLCFTESWRATCKNVSWVHECSWQRAEKDHEHQLGAGLCSCAGWKHVFVSLYLLTSVFIHDLSGFLGKKQWI